MSDALAIALGWGVCAIAFFSYLGVHAWVSAQQREREAFYRSEAIKKLAEMQGTAPEAVMELLKQALQPPPGAPSVWTATPSVMREFYRNEMLKRVAETQGQGGEGVVAIMREEERRAQRRSREGLKLASLILIAIGIALIGYLKLVVLNLPVYLAGLFPLAVGLAMMVYILFLAPRLD